MENKEKDLWCYHVERLIDMHRGKNAKRVESLLRIIFGQSIQDAIERAEDDEVYGDDGLICGLKAAWYFFLNEGFEASGIDSLMLEEMICNAVMDCVDYEIERGEGTVFPAICALIDYPKGEDFSEAVIIQSLFWDTDWDLFEIDPNDRIENYWKLIPFCNASAPTDAEIGFTEESVIQTSRSLVMDRGNDGFVYIIKGQAKPLKIGYTSKNPNHRLKTLQTSHHEKLHIIASFRHSGAKRIEKEAHSLLSQFRLSGEWFSCPPSLAKDTIRNLIIQSGNINLKSCTSNQ